MGRGIERGYPPQVGQRYDYGWCRWCNRENYYCHDCQKHFCLGTGCVRNGGHQCKRKPTVDTDKLKDAVLSAIDKLYEDTSVECIVTQQVLKEIQADLVHKLDVVNACVRLNKL